MGYNSESTSKLFHDWAVGIESDGNGCSLDNANNRFRQDEAISYQYSQQ